MIFWTIFFLRQLRCVGMEVWDDLKPGDQIRVLFDEYGRVAQAQFVK